MPKINFNGLARPVRKSETRTFTDPAQPGLSLALTLRTPDAFDQLLITDKAGAFEKEYAVNFFPVGGEAVPVTDGVAKVLCSLEVMQVVEDEEDRYTAHDLMGMLVSCPQAAEDVINWAMTLLPTGNTSGNPSGTGEPAGSAPS